MTKTHVDPLLLIRELQKDLLVGLPLLPHPDRWNDVKDYLPLLRKPEYFRTVNHGFARGDEPVRYVQNIRHYYSLLSWQEINKVSPDIRQKVADYVPKSIINALPAL